MIRIAVSGAAGRMGKAIINCAALSKGIRVTAAFEQAGNPAIGRDAGVLAGSEPCGVPVSRNANCISAADVLVDFSSHGAAPANLKLAASLKKAVVLGTTGLTPSERRAVLSASRRIPIVWAPNMSLGVNLLFDLVRRTAETLDLDYDVEIVEVHHRFKKDAPSGTALRLGEQAAAGRRQKFESVANYGRKGLVGERPRGQIGIHSVRAGDTVGDHTVIFSTGGERVELTHRATSRDSFALGALKAVRWVRGRRPGLYDMRDVLGLD